MSCTTYSVHISNLITSPVLSPHIPRTISYHSQQNWWCREACTLATTAFTPLPAHSRAVRGGSFSRTGRGPSGWTEASPGPGAYQCVEQASQATLQSQPAFSFSSGRNARTCMPPAGLLASCIHPVAQVVHEEVHADAEFCQASNAVVCHQKRSVHSHTFVNVQHYSA